MTTVRRRSAPGTPTWLGWRRGGDTPTPACRQDAQQLELGINRRRARPPRDRQVDLPPSPRTERRGACRQSGWREPWSSQARSGRPFCRRPFRVWPAPRVSTVTGSCCGAHFGVALAVGLKVQLDRVHSVHRSSDRRDQADGPHRPCCAADSRGCRWNPSYRILPLPRRHYS